MKSSQAKADLIVQKAAEELAEKAKQRAPVATGALRDSIEAKRTGVAEAEVVVGDFKGHFHEFGTSKMAATPFLIPAAEEIRDDLARAMREIV